MNHSDTSPNSRPEAAPTAPDLDELLEEIRQLRASIATYRMLVERLIDEGRTAA